MKNKTIALIGGDKRQLFCADALYKKGFEVLVSGFDLLESYGGLKLVDVDTALYRGDIFILPIVGLKGDVIPCYFSDKEIKLTKKLKDKLRKKPVFMGKSASLKDIKAYDLLKREDFAVLNAVLTVEGALCLAIKSYEKTICGSKILVIGYGRIGKILSQRLKALGAFVTAASLKSYKHAYIKADGNTPMYTSDLQSLNGFDIVFNTAEFTAVNRKILENSGSDTIIIDLASYPGGVDFDAAEKLGFTAIMASGLPGQYSPSSAGEIIADTVLTILREESL